MTFSIKNMKVILILFLNFSTRISFSEGQVYVTPQQVQHRKFDFIVVGAGSGGATVAKRLSERPDLSILVIEAGPPPSALMSIPGLFLYHTLSSETWQYPIEPQTECFKSYPGQKFNYAQGKVLGGTSSINGMLYVRGSKQNYDEWAALGLSEWSYEKVLPFYKKAEGNTRHPIDTRYHGTKGPLTVSRLPYETRATQAFIKDGIEVGLPEVDYNLPNQTGVGVLDFTIRNGTRCSTYLAYLNRVPTHTNLFILNSSVVTKVLFRENTANGVEFINNGKTFRAKATREVIISCGALGSPKLLMHSGIGPRKQLEKCHIKVLADRPGVGENLIDHVGVIGLIWKLNCTNCAYPLATAAGFESLASYEASNSGPLSTASGVEGTAFFSTKYSPKCPDIQLFFLSTSFAGMPEVEARLDGVKLDIIKKYYAPFSTAASTVSIWVTVVQPKSVGFVHLNSCDPLAYPTVNFNFMKNQIDVKAMIEGVKKAKKIGDSAAFKCLGAEFIPGHYPGCECHTLYSDAYWDCFIRGLNYLLYHPVGTCKMGLARDCMAVVDQDLKVYGVKNLRVIDASVMPLIPAANTNAPTIMLGEKGAHIILSSIPKKQGHSKCH